MFYQRVIWSCGFAMILAFFFMGMPFQAVAEDESSLDKKTKNALVAAITDEYKAKALYSKILDKFGSQRPFSNIVEAEEKHIQILMPLFAKYQVPVPENNWSAKVNVPESMLEACKQGVAAEIENVKMYDEILPSINQADIKEVFIYLRDASRDNHLPAFQRCVERGGEMGPGRGQGKGKGMGRGYGKGKGGGQN